MSDGSACARSGHSESCSRPCVESGQGLWTFFPFPFPFRAEDAIVPSCGKSENNFTTKLAQLGSSSRAESESCLRVIGPAEFWGPMWRIRAGCWWSVPHPFRPGKVPSLLWPHARKGMKSEFSVVVFRWASGAAVVGGFYDFYGFNQPRWKSGP